MKPRPELESHMDYDPSRRFDYFQNLVLEPMANHLDDVNANGQETYGKTAKQRVNVMPTLNPRRFILHRESQRWRQSMFFEILRHIFRQRLETPFCVPVEKGESNSDLLALGLGGCGGDGRHAGCENANLRSS
jgi:hypothetical protein